MLIAERRQRILDHVNARGYASFRDLATELGASESTVRRDLRSLIEEGRLIATRGGVSQPGGAGPALPSRQDPHAAEREAIATQAASLVEPGTAILLGPGRTTAVLARKLVALPALTVVTNSVLVVAALAEAPQVELVVVGGTLRRSIQALVGPITEQSLVGLRGAQVFLSGDGVTAERGLTTPNVFAAATDQAFAAAGREVVVLADHSKIGNDTMCQTVPADRMNVLVTGPAAEPAVVGRLAQIGVDVVIVDRF
ncbi:DeoR/GlpR family DNA-binding transcription regulator [Nonomuraea sp. NPDC050663]|uniref:DeoR/GlpR family DNA-binding transcription regulator n=1 Tax=Nonomuraea sp. NPDC050663 TaxID=3364370 RepID=UPI0037A67765